MCVYIYIHICVCIYECIHTHIHSYVYTHICNFWSDSSSSPPLMNFSCISTRCLPEVTHLCKTSYPLISPFTRCSLTGIYYNQGRRDEHCFLLVSFPRGLNYVRLFLKSQNAVLISKRKIFKSKLAVIIYPM